MKKWWYSLLSLLLFAGPALADSANPTISSSAVTNKTDLSIAYLSSFFGTVSGVLTGTSGQMFGKTMYQFNQGILVLAGFWLAFTIITMFLKAALSGSFMQQDNKVAFIFLRIALGFGLLIPNPSTGYTVLQGIVMQVVVQGVKLADQIWEYGLDYMNAGGALWSRPVQQGTQSGTNANPTNIMSDSDKGAILGSADTSTAQATIANFATLSMIQKIMTMEACMVQSSIDNEGDSSDSVSNQPNFSVYEDVDHFNFQFPGGSGDNNALCGTVSWSSLGLSAISAPTDALGCQAAQDNSSQTSPDNTKCGFSHLALREVIFDLLPAVKKYVCLQNPSNSLSTCSGIDPSDGDNTYMTDAMMGALINYKNLIDPMVRADQLAKANAGQTGGANPLAFINQAKAEGWMSAGRYYWDLLSVEGFYDQMMTGASDSLYQNYIPNSYVAPNVAGQSTPNVGNQTSPGNLLTATITTYIPAVNQLMDNFSNAASSGNAAMSRSASFSALGWIGNFIALFIPVLANLSQLFMAFSTNLGPFGLGPDPIIWLHKIGMLCISLGGNIWLGVAGALFPISLVAWICSSTSPTGPSIKSVLDWLQPLFMVAAAGFFAVGISLGFYMPLYPYMLFTFGVIGWLVAIAEAMVAAPLVAMGITHPGNHDFLGRAEQSVMLLVSLFVRPALMVIGLFAGMILCQVSLSIVLYTFSGFASDIFYVSGPASGAPSGDVLLKGVASAANNVMGSGAGAGMMLLLLPLIIFPMFLAIFTGIVYTVTTTAFSLIHHLPDYVLSWIGGPQARGVNAGQMVEKIAHGMSGAAQSGSQGINNSISADKEKKAQKGGTQASAPVSDSGSGGSEDKKVTG